MESTVRAGAWKGIVELVRRLGGEPADILQDVGLPADLLSDLNAYYPPDALVNTLETAARSLDRPDFGLMSGEFSPVDLGTLALGIMNSPSVRHGINMASRFIHIHNRGLLVEILPQDQAGLEFISIYALNPLYTNSVQMAERQVAGLCFHLKGLQGESYEPTEIRLTNARLSPPERYEKVIGLVPVFECATGGVVLTTEALDAPRPGCDEDIRELAEARLAAMGQANTEILSNKVDMLISGLLPGNDCTIARISSILGMHDRTLQRRLREEGTSFEQLKDRVKRRRAEALLAREDVSLTDVAFMLGYSESATFSRKARDWFGVPPRDYRQRLIGGQA